MNLASHQRRQHGFSLVELMISMLLGLIVIAGATSVFLSNKQLYRTSTALGRVQENSRTAFDLITRDLRQSRLTGCGNQDPVPRNNLNANTDPANWYANFAANGLIGYDGGSADDNPAVTTLPAASNHISGTDSLMLIGASDIAYSLNSLYDADDGLDILESSPELAAGDVIVVCDPAKADIVQITSISGGKFKLEATGMGPGNASVPDDNSYNLNSMVSRLKAVSWYIGCNSVATTPACDPEQGGTSLYRINAVGNASSVSVVPQSDEMVRGVAAVDFKFHKPGDPGFTDTAGVTSWAPANVDAVRISVRLVARDSQNLASPVISRSFSTIVSLRNPPAPITP
ncbi:MAG: prepilin-type N-terminal cleavage/methylation domain-containing protein [Pseudomonadota bacterium]